MAEVKVKPESGYWLRYPDAYFTIEEETLLVSEYEYTDFGVETWTIAAWPKGTWLHAKLEA